MKPMQVAIQSLALPARLRTERQMSDTELMAFCTANEALRVERDSNGELLLMGPAGLGTSRRNTQILLQLARWAEEDGRGLTFDSNGGFTLPDGSMRSPDAAWVSWGRWNALDISDQDRFAPLCPDFVIELRSPSDALPELQAKMGMWIRNGAELAWLVDPQRKVVEVYRPGCKEPEVVEDASGVWADRPVGGFVLELGRIWA